MLRPEEVGMKQIHDVRRRDNLGCGEGVAVAEA